jgi:hypothetical protein
MRWYDVSWDGPFAKVCAVNDEVRSWLPSLVIFLLGVFEWKISSTFRWGHVQKAEPPGEWGHNMFSACFRGDLLESLGFSE